MSVCVCMCVSLAQMLVALVCEGDTREQLS